jgi:hypothetical protein
VAVLLQPAQTAGVDFIIYDDDIAILTDQLMLTPWLCIIPDRLFQ